MEAARDVTPEEWDRTKEMVTEAVREIQAGEESPVLGAVLDELEDPTSDFLNAVVERLIS